MKVGERVEAITGYALQEPPQLPSQCRVQELTIDLVHAEGGSQCDLRLTPVGTTELVEEGRAE